MKISHKGLLFGSYSAYQMEFYDKVLNLRNREKLTFNALIGSMGSGGTLEKNSGTVQSTWLPAKNIPSRWSEPGRTSDPEVPQSYRKDPLHQQRSVGDRHSTAECSSRDSGADDPSTQLELKLRLEFYLRPKSPIHSQILFFSATSVV